MNRCQTGHREGRIPRARRAGRTRRAPGTQGTLRAHRDEEFSRAFKALGHPQRLALVARLLARGAACCEAERVDDCSLDPASCRFGELAAGLDVSPATVSHHLKELWSAGVLARHRRGRHVYWHVEESMLERLREFFGARHAAPASKGGAR